MKILGIKFQNNLKWNAHMDTILNVQHDEFTFYMQNEKAKKYVSS